MSDGRIKIDIEIDGKPVSAASKELDRLEESGAKSGKGIKSAEDSMDSLADSSAKAGDSVKGTADDLDDMGNKSNKATGNVKKFATAIGLIAIASAAFKVLSASMDDAITRFDTLNNFPKVLQALGVSAEDSEKAMNNLSDGIDGLPTKLDDIASTAQRMYSSFDDMNIATDSALALNNAFLGSGASAEKAKRGTEQYIQALQTGKMDMMQWRTLQETMDVGLIKIAESFGYAGKSAKDDLYQALQDGTVTMDDFNDKLIEVGTGTGVMAGLAKENSLGIATSLGNLKIAAARGIADIIDSFDKLSKEVTGKDIAQNLDSLKKIVSASFSTIGSAIEKTAPIVVAFASGVKTTIPIVKSLTPVIVGLMTAYAAHAVITKASTAISASNKILATAMASQKALTLAKKADTTATVANTGAISLGNVVIGLLTGKMKLSTAAIVIKTAATYALSTALKFLSGPVGWVTVGIGALAGAAVAVVKWFKRTSAETEQLKDETEELSNSTDSLVDSIDGTAEAYKDNVRNVTSSAGKNKELAKQIDELSAKENKSAADKALLASHIESLNGSIDGLNLAYDEEAGALSMSSEELRARLDLMKETEAGLAAQERLTEIIQEQNDAQMQLDEINEKQAEWIELQKEGGEQAVVAAAELEKLEEKEIALKETIALLGEQFGITEEQIIEASANATAAIEEGNLRQITSYEDLEGEHKETFDNMKSRYDELVENATNAFDRMNEESKVTGEEMLANLEHNAEMTAQWGENVAKLMEYAGKDGNDGFLQWLDTMGSDSAAELAEIANMSEPELDRFIELMNEAPQVAGEGFKTALGDEFDEAIDVMINFVDDGSKTLREQIKSSGFDDIGSMVPEGLVSGIEGGTPDAEAAAKNLADDTTAATREAFKTRSPSRVYKEIGGDVTEGLAIGIQQGTDVVLTAIKNMFKGVQVDSVASFKTIISDYDKSIELIGKSLEKLPKHVQKAMLNMLNRMRTGKNQQTKVMSELATAIPRQFNNTPSRLNGVGLMAMAGLNSGLNAGSGRVMATARRIANNVNATMKRALDIHSPSRKARDEVGKEYTAGVALGIEENARMAYDAVNKLASGMMMSTPEVALGTSRMAYTGAGSVSNSSSIANNDHSKSYNPTIQNYFTREESTPSESARKQKQQQQRLAMEMGF